MTAGRPSSKRRAPGRTTGQASERQLLAAARKGDARALRRLVEAVAGPAYRFGRGFCGDEHDAEDIAQEVLAALVRGLARFRGDASLTTWAYTVARHACGRHRRRRSGAPPRLEPLDGVAGGEALQVADPASDPVHDAERRQLRLAIDRAIRALPGPQREVILLRDVEGLPAPEVARVLGLTERAVKSRLHRARVELRATLMPFLPAAPPGDRRLAHGAIRRGTVCPDLIPLVSRHLEGDLDAEACAALEAHVVSCATCLGERGALLEALRACRSCGQRPLPRRLHGAVREALRKFVAEGLATD